MADDTITTVMELDLSPYRKALEKMPKDAQKALKELEREAISSAKKLASAQEKLSKRTASTVSKHARDQARAAQKAARDTERAYDEQFTSIMGLSGAAFGGIAGDVEDLGTTLVGVSGPMALLGVGLAALTIAPELLRGVHEFASGIDETAEALGLVLSPEQQAAQDSFSDATKALTQEWLSLKLELQLVAADGLVPLMDDAKFLVSILAGVADAGSWFGGLGDAVGKSKSEFQDMLGPLGSVMKYFTSSPLEQFRMWKSAFQGAAADFEPMVQGLEDVQKAMEGVNEEAEKTGTVYHDSGETAASVLKEFRDRRTKGAKDAADEIAQMEKEALEDIAAGREAEHKAANARYAARVKMGHDAAAAAIVDIQAEQDAERAAQIAEGERRQQSLDAEKAAAEEMAEAYAAAKEKMGEAMRATQAIGGEASAALAGFSALAVQGAEREAAAKRKAAKNIGKTIKGLEKMRETATGADLARIESRIQARKDEQKNMRKLAKKANKRALNAWKAGKAAQISATVMNGIAAGIAFLAPPPMGLGPVAGGVAAGLLAGSVTAAVAEIATQKPPKFHQGGIVAPPRQEVAATLETGEGVIRREAMMQPGATETVERMNAGGAVGGQPMAVYLNDRLVDVLVARAERTDAQSRRGLAMVGTRTMYDRRR